MSAAALHADEKPGLCQKYAVGEATCDAIVPGPAAIKFLAPRIIFYCSHLLERWPKQEEAITLTSAVRSAMSDAVAAFRGVRTTDRYEMATCSFRSAAVDWKDFGLERFACNDGRNLAYQSILSEKAY